jgi:hypothetical protein
MNLSDKVTIPPQVMARVVGADTVILDLVSGTYFGLDPIGARIWELLGEGKTLVEVCEAIQQSHEVSRADIERDLLCLVDALHVQRLIDIA